MIILRQKEFSNKEQKRLRRKWDLEQAKKADPRLDDMSWFHRDGRFDGKNWISDSDIINKNAQRQQKKLGDEKTIELLKKGENSTKSTRIPGSKIRSIYSNVKNRKEVEEIEKAQDAIRLGRLNSRNVSNRYDKEIPRLNTLIQNGWGGAKHRSKDGKYERDLRKRFDERKERLEKEKLAAEKEKLAAEKLAKKAAKKKELIEKSTKLLKDNKKALIISGSTIAAAGATYGGVKAAKAIKKKKESKKED